VTHAKQLAINPMMSSMQSAMIAMTLIIALPMQAKISAMQEKMIPIFEFD